MPRCILAYAVSLALIGREPLPQLCSQHQNYQHIEISSEDERSAAKCH